MRYSLMLLLLLVCSGIKAQNSKIYTDTVVAGAFSGGIVHDGSLHLIASDRYDTLNVVKKRAAIAKLSKDFESSIIIISNGPKRELWIWEKNGIPEFIDEWNLDEMEIEEYLPLEIEKSGPNRLFWYAGGNMNGASGSFTGTASRFWRNTTAVMNTICRIRPRCVSWRANICPSRAAITPARCALRRRRRSCTAWGSTSRTVSISRAARWNLPSAIRRRASRCSYPRAGMAFSGTILPSEGRRSPRTWHCWPCRPAPHGRHVGRHGFPSGWRASGRPCAAWRSPWPSRLIPRCAFPRPTSCPTTAGRTCPRAGGWRCLTGTMRR